MIQVESLLHRFSCDALLVTDPLDIFYLTGMSLSVGTLFFVKGEQPTLFVDGRYREVASHLPLRVEDIEHLPGALNALKAPCGFDSDHLTYAKYLALIKKKETIFPLASPIKELRKIKSQEEIKTITKAAQLCMRGMQTAIDSLREGISEREVAYELELFWKREGGEKFSFDPIIAFGENSSKPHYRSGSTTLKRGQIVLIDIGVVVDHYHSDMTRTVAFGTIDSKLSEIYNIVYEAKKRAIAGCVSGKAIKDIDALARDYITEKGYGDAFMHGLGHGIGLETHEPPYLNKKATAYLEEGEVVTIEPGIYIPDLGGVRIEDMILVQKGGCHNLTSQFDSDHIIKL
jgi:Xaa-Pro aminopeptidase